MLTKIAFLGAGSCVFVLNVLGDTMLHDCFEELEYALYDIDAVRAEESRMMLEAMNHKYRGGKVTIKTYIGLDALGEALQGADFVINAIQVGGYEPCTVTDFEIPKKYGLRQTIADTLGVGGIFRALRTIPVMETFAQYVEKYCPNALFLNYTNPMAILTGYMLRYTNVNLVGLCHSVQVAVPKLLAGLGMEYDDRIQWKIAGINHMAWLLEVSKDGKDLYPEIKRRSLEQGAPADDRVRHEIMHKFGYYVTESSEHNAEYMPYFIKARNPELIERFNIPLDEYPRRCVRHIEEWAEMRDKLIHSQDLDHEQSKEYAAYIMESIVTNKAFKFGGNVLNKGLIPNLPYDACVEVPCISDASGVTPCYVGNLPEQCAALNRTNINVQQLTILAAHTKKKEDVYHAAMLDPHTAAELTMDEIISMCDDLFEAHKDWLPEYK